MLTANQASSFQWKRLSGEVDKTPHMPTLQEFRESFNLKKTNGTLKLEEQQEQLQGSAMEWSITPIWENTISRCSAHAISFVKVRGRTTTV